jgi:crotonobetainyl-CoA:carnitine CoA-transferase CaiB-like acyl-CoA transferase
VPKFSRSETTVTAPPPLGYHTAEILAERLGYADDEIAELRRQRTI